jgi:hypothetical protein
MPTAWNILPSACPTSGVSPILFDFAVPFANNQAEQNIRMLEPQSGSREKMKMSGAFRTK